ncbi:MAG: N-acetylmuramoyl-L-alanine amidase [Bacteroidota bacterium]
MALTIKKVPLLKGEYYEEVRKKDTIIIHHTAGGHRPDWTIAGWNADRTTSGQRLRVATAYIIGGLSITDGDASWDGTICNCFPDNYWAHHLGLKTTNNVLLNKKSIAIEICNYGPLTLSAKDGKFYNYVNKQVPAGMVVELSKPFRGYKYYHKYTDKQIASLKDLLLQLSKTYGINLKTGLQPLLNAGKGADAFLVNKDALAGKPGLWTHASVRKDKFDCSPQDNLMAMLKSL